MTPSPSKSKRKSVGKETEIITKPELAAAVPEADAWVEFKTYRACQLPDSEKTKLQVGDRIYVNPGVTASETDVKEAKKNGKGKKGRKSEQAASSGERWLARIEQIRALNKVDVYLKISWYYSADQLRSIGYKHMKHLNLQGGELVHTDHTEIIPVSTCDDKATVFEYDECDENQVQIAADDYFVRYKTINLCAGSKKDGDKYTRAPSGPDAKLALPEPIQPPSSTSGQAYEPLPLSSETRMHYCPKAVCKTWYHVFDLTNGSRDRTSADAVDFERNTGEEDDTPQSDDLLDEKPVSVNEDGKREHSDDEDASAAKKVKTNEGGVAAAGKPEKEAKEAIYDPAKIEELPPAILNLARAPITRGSVHAGIVGTAQATLAARRIMRDVCARDQTLPEDWAEQVLLFEPGEEPETDIDVEALEAEGKEQKDIAALRNIAQAAHDTWTDRTKRQKLLSDASGSEMGGPDGKTVFVCPSCLHLI